MHFNGGNITIKKNAPKTFDTKTSLGLFISILNAKLWMIVPLSNIELKTNRPTPSDIAKITNLIGCMSGYIYWVKYHD